MTIKKQFNIILLFAAILIGLTACQNSTKQQLVGTWSYTTHLSTDDSEVFGSGTESLNEDGTYSEEGTVVFSGNTEVEGMNLRVKATFGIKGSGEWTLNDEKEIVFSPTSVGTKVISYRLSDPDDETNFFDLTGSELQEFSQEFAQEIKQDLLEASTERIIMLNENKLVTESTDEDGKKSSTTYNRIK